MLLKAGNYINDVLSKELKAFLDNKRVDREHQHVQRAGGQGKMLWSFQAVGYAAT
jgi:hypothetical protein